jgi:hypothetical protein
MRTVRARGTVLLVLGALLCAPAAAQYGSGGDAGSRAAAVESLLADPEAQRLLDADPALKRRLQQAYAKLNMASDGYTSADIARQQAIAAAREFAQIESLLRTRIEQARAAAEAALREQEEAQRVAMRAEADEFAADAKRLLALPAPHDEWTLERRGELGRALQAYQRLGRDASLPDLRTALDRLASAGADVDAALRGASEPRPPAGRPRAGGVTEAPAHPAPERLRDAIAAFLAGRYAGAADLLADANLGDEHATKVAYMVRGAALFSLYVESGERDAALLDRVRADVQACRRLDPNAVPSRLLFSPRYAELFAP